MMEPRTRAVCGGDHRMMRGEGFGGALPLAWRAARTTPAWQSSAS
jgi:hypothetical protein